MKKFLIFLQIILFSFNIGKSPVYADEYVSEISDTDVSADIKMDNFSSVELEKNTAEIGEEVDVLITLSDYLGNPITDHSVRIYIDGDDTGVTLVQPGRTNQRGETVGSIKTDSAGMYKVKAVDDTYGYDIEVVSFDTLYTVPLQIPSLFEEPPYTKGTKNTLIWTYEFGYQYYIEAGKSSSFDTVVGNSGWISKSQYTFTDLDDSTMYFFRLKKRNIGGGESNWSESVYSIQDNTAPVVTFISIENLDTSSSSADDFLEIKAKIEDNLSLYSQVTYCVLSDGSLKECTSVSSLDGSIYTSNISFDDLEKDTDGKLLNSYSFCIEAADEAGNMSRNCDIEIVLKTEEEADINENQNENIDISDFNFKAFIFSPLSIVNFMQTSFAERDILLLTSIICVISLYIVLSIFFENVFVPLIYLSSVIFLFRRRGNFEISGVIYDSKTKNPLRYPLVKIFSKEGKFFFWLSGNSEGEFKTKLNIKDIYLTVSKSGYIFPSTLVTENTDYPLENIYHGKNIKLRSTLKNVASVPLDLKERNIWETVLSIFKYFLFVLFFIFFVFGFLFCIYMLKESFSLLLLFVLLIYIFNILILIKYLISRYHRYGSIKDEEGKIVEGIDIVIRDQESMKILERRVSDMYGRYSVVLESGKYILDILNKEYELIAVEDGREFSIDEKERCTKDLIVRKK